MIVIVYMFDLLGIFLYTVCVYAIDCSLNIIVDMNLVVIILLPHFVCFVRPMLHYLHQFA